MPDQILVVEDEEEMRHLIAEALAEAGYGLCVPVDGYVAMEIALEQEPALIVLDSQMPLLDGLGFVRSLVGHSIRAKIVLLADGLSDSEIEEYRALGVASVIQKPFPLARLSDLVTQVLSGGTPSVPDN